MARIRSVHPGFFSDERYVTLSALARVFLIGVWTQCDDQGVFEWKPTTLKMRILPAENADATKLLAELAAADCVRGYEHEGRQLGAVRNFRKYQRPKSPKCVHFIPSNFRNYVGLDADDSEIPPQMEDGGGEMEEVIPSGSERKRRTPPPVLLELTPGLRELATAEGRDADREFENCRDWCADNGKRLTAPRFRNWLRSPYGRETKGSNGVRPNGSGRVDARSVARKIAEAEGMVGDADRPGGSVSPTAGDGYSPGISAENLPRRIGRAVEPTDRSEGREVGPAQVEVLPVDRGAGSGVPEVRSAVVHSAVEAVSPAERTGRAEGNSPTERTGTSSLRLVEGGVEVGNDGRAVGEAARSAEPEIPEYLIRNRR